MENYTTICDVCGKKTWYEEEQRCHCVYAKMKTCQSCKHSEEVYPPKMVRCQGRLHRIDESELDERLTPYYRSQKRIEITWKKGYEDYTGYGNKTNGLKQRCYVGKSTGWKPVYLAILSSRSLGGSTICSEAIESIREL